MHPRDGSPPPSNWTSGPRRGDYERYSYDANGNRTNLRKRDTRNIAFAYDALNRVTAKTYPQGGAAPVHYGYDLRNLQLSARFDSQSGEGVTNAYDGFGRLASSSVNQSGAVRTLHYQHDAGGNRTAITHPDGHFFTYGRDGLNRPTQLAANGGPGLVGVGYFDHGAAATINRANGNLTGLGYDDILRPDGVIHFFAGGGHAYWGWGSNPAGQARFVVADNDAFAWTGHYPVDRNYTTNGLNQYTATGGPAFSYDLNGNLTSDGSRSYVYDIENRLVGASNGAALSYDPLGRLFEVSSAATGTTRFLYDGDALAAEYDGSNGAMLRRHIHWVGADVPVVTFDGADLAQSRYLHAGRLGSIVARTDAAGALVTANSYDEYGIPGAANGGQFQYTGQVWLEELGMYHYKARVYSPTLGRFLQTDPVGYEDQFNLYAYVGNDPVSHIDPSGRQSRRVPLPGTLPFPGVPTVGDRDGNGYDDNAEAGAAALQRSFNWLRDVVRGGIDYLLSEDVTVVDGSPPSRGEPGSTVQGRGTTRKYDDDGYPAVDVDSPNPGARPGSIEADEHAHDWVRPDDGSFPERGGHRERTPRDPVGPHRGDPERRAD